MRLLTHILTIATSLSLAACMLSIPVYGYTATDGSSFFRKYASAWDCKNRRGDVSSTVILDRPNVHVELDVSGVWQQSNVLWAAIVVNVQPGTFVRLPDRRVEINSPDFAAPLFFDARDWWVEGTARSYVIWISLPTIPTELSIRLPRLEVEGQPVELRNLVLRSERWVKQVPLACQS
jgi:hypothetical protein